MLEIKLVAKNYGKELFSQLSFEVAQGERLSIVGPSGCGKTTLLRCISGLDSFDTGDIFLNGVNLNNALVEKRDIGLIFQKPVLYHHLDVEGNLRLADRRSNVAKALKEVGLEGFEKRSTESLSGGEAQRVALARAFLAKPRALLLDEPFSALDEALRKRLLNDIIRILEERKMIGILVTHNLTEASIFSEKIVKMG